MKKILILILVLYATASAAALNKSGGFYLNTKLGIGATEMSVITKDTTTTFSPSIALGVRSRGFRFELEGTNTDNVKVDGLRAVQTRLMLQGYVDLPLRTRIRPFINAGAGFSFLSAQVENAYGYLYRRHESDTSFAWNAGGGFTIIAADHLSIQLGYRYVDFGDQEVFDTPIETTAHEGYLGLSYEF